MSAYLFLRRGETIDSIAVMPFVNASGDPNMEYLSDGISENLINSLTQVSKLRVVPRGTVFRYKGKEDDWQEIGKKLNVHSILMGRVVQRGDSLNVQTELVDVAKDSQLWGAQYNRKLTDILKVQEEIATVISDKLRLPLTGAEQKLLTKRYTENTEAYQLYLKGRYHGSRVTEGAFGRGIQYFNQAIEKDPGFALAYAGLANTYNALSSLGYLAPKETFPKAKAAARKALALDDNLADAHAALAYATMYYDWNWQEAEKEFKRAIALNPNYAQAHMWYGLFLDMMGRFEEALPEYDRARKLEPLTPMINALTGFHYYYARRFEQARKQLAAMLEVEPNFAVAHFYLAVVYLHEPTLGDAMPEFQRAVALEPGNPGYIAGVGRAYAAAGKRGEALKILGDLQELSKRRYVTQTQSALILAHMEGKRDEAFEALERAYEERSPYMCQLKVLPAFDLLRSDLRFKALLRRINFPE
jgi:TolB-like protein/Tfp pilus assembly protein PilF